VVIVGFFSIVLYSMPASWVVPRPPAVVTCGAVTGSIWHGNCAGLTLAGQPWGDVRWSLHAGSLLALMLNAHVSVSRGPARAEADVSTGLTGLAALARGAGRITLRNLEADLPLDPALIPLMPPAYGGRAHAELTLLTLSGGLPTQIEGRVDLHDVVDHGSGNTALGSYSLTFPPGASGLPTALIRDLGGPLAVDGTVRLTQPPGYHIQGLVAARPTASADVAQSLKYLGSPDAQGRRQFEMEGRF
jgi:general secretion pathway protein N